MGILRETAAMLGQAFTDAIDNSLKPEGGALQNVEVSVLETRGFAAATAMDDGVDLAANKVGIDLAHFGQTTPGKVRDLVLPFPRPLPNGRASNLISQPSRKV